ncbi:MAG: hypothetical protein O8C64_05265 [Candidatus Methanoperedens sp.]|nr:hypothetical protein [Candidatus Methanoperedens sp.]MCZ7404331.1 hypothetical protein [Candidatus Methanoperedens sp.]
MVDWKKIKLVYGENTLEHITKHRVNLSEVHNVLEGYFMVQRIVSNGILRYLVLGESYGRVLMVILEPAGTNEMRLITAYDASESRKKLYREKVKK